MCSHVAILSPGYFCCSNKPCNTLLNATVSLIRFHEAFMSLRVSLKSIRSQFRTVSVKNTHLWVGYCVLISSSFWNMTALHNKDLRHWQTGQNRTRQKKKACFKTSLSSPKPNFKMPEQPLIRSAYLLNSSEYSYSICTDWALDRWVSQGFLLVLNLLKIDLCHVCRDMILP